MRENGEADSSVNQIMLLRQRVLNVYQSTKGDSVEEALNTQFSKEQGVSQR
jgi:hypothetical protein